MARESRRRRRQRPPAPGAWFDDEAADRVVDFFPQILVHTKGPLAGQPFELLPWERDFVRYVFGWHRQDGTRVVRKALLGVPKKNGKTTLGAGIALYMLTADGEQSADVFSAAGDRHQAALVFDTARRMVQLSEDLSGMIDLYRHHMEYAETASIYRVLSADAGTKHGLNAHCVIFDELHTQPNRELFDTLEGAGAARAQPLHLYITTAGYDRASVCWEVWEYARKVEKGIVEDPSFYARIYEAGEGEDWTDRKVWRKANPNLGISVDESFLAEECEKAKASPARQNAFRRLHLNQWTRQRDRWLDLAAWDACASDLMPAEIEKACEGRFCYAGLDLASTTDLSALVLVFPPPEGEEADGLYDVVCRFWVPDENAILREKRDRVPYLTWCREGFLTLTDGNVTDYRYIRQELLGLANRFEIRELAFDRWGSQKIVSELQDDGLTLAAFGQGIASMSPPTKELLHLVLQQRVRHGGHPVLRWCADNLVVRHDPAGNVKPDKEKSTEKIDGMVALIMAVDRAIRLEGGEPGSVYDQRGILTL